MPKPQSTFRRQQPVSGPTQSYGSATRPNLLYHGFSEYRTSELEGVQRRGGQDRRALSIVLRDRIDLEHRGEIPTYDWSFFESEQDEYRPFIRVTNSYNRTCLFGIHFGLVRWACKNGVKADG